jgi:hypothetical protein
MIVRAKFNGKGPFNFIVDTGAPAMFVTTEVAKKVGVKPDDDGWATFDRMEIEGGATLDDAKARVEDIFQIRGMNALSLPGIKLDGVLGYTLLARYRMEFDLSKTTMTWTELDFDPPLPQPLAGDNGGRAGGAPPELEMVGGLMKVVGAMLGRGETEIVVPRGFLGIELAEAGGKVTVKTVLPESPAARAGLENGDTLATFAGKSVRSAADVLKLATTIGPNADVQLVVERNGDKIELTATTGRGF